MMEKLRICCMLEFIRDGTDGTLPGDIAAGMCTADV